MIQLEDKLYTSTEVANILGVSLRSVYRYLEENKIKAEVKTATGRHRFSKGNILDFLYPNEREESVQSPVLPKVVKGSLKQEEVKPAPKVEVFEEAVEEVEINQEVTTATETATTAEEPVEEPIDWLAKFREAARKYREESQQSEQPEQPVAVPAQEEPMTMAETLKVSNEPAFVQDISSDEKPSKETTKQFYRSSLGGLKDIAQNIDRGSRNSYLDYAFTMNAGLSLFKPIKPFSILHAYVRPGDLSFFEKLLGLTPTDESNSQLCLLLSDEADVYKNKEELHGLFVVSKERLLKDVKAMGDGPLVTEASSILK